MAKGRLAFERAGAATGVREAYAESPLKLLTPRSDQVFVSTLGGGLVDGDRISLEIEVGIGARAFVTSQGPTRVFRGSSSAETRAAVAAGASLVLAPAPAACFAGARFEQRTTIELAPDATLAFWDVLSAGRERWGFARYRNALRVVRDGRALIDEALLLDAAHGPLPERLGRFDAIATLLLVGGDVQLPEEPLRADAPLLESASRLAPGVTVTRFAAASVELILRTLRARIPEAADLWRSDASFAA